MARQNLLSKKKFFLLFVVLLSAFLAEGQQKFRVSGSLNGSGIGYAASGIPARRDPFYWLLSGNLTLSYWQITAPFSFTLSQQDQTFRYPQPFNQFGISPTYKFITLHLGYRSMNFSEFTLAGTIFMGAGIDVAPPNSLIKVSAMYGRFAKARIVGGLNDLEFGIPSYERWGFGTKITIGKNGQEADLIVFRGRDDPTTLPDTLAAKLNVSPAENFVWGVNVRRTITKRLNINAEYALSAYTKDIRDPEVELSSYKYANYLGNLYTPAISSQFNAAFQGQVAYKADRYQINLKYRRLGPDYKTMGSPFMNNDFEDLTAGVAIAFLDNKLNISTSAGVQRNNLKHTQETSVKRFIGSINTSIVFSDKLNISLSYSNFNSSTKLDRFYQQSQADQVDSLLFLQVTNSINATLHYNLTQGSITRSIILSNAYQIASDNLDNKSIFYNVNAGYQVNNTPVNFSYNINVNLNSNTIGNFKNSSVGPTVTVSKLFFSKKIRTLLSSACLQSYQSGNRLSTTYTVRTGYSYATKSRHTFGLDFSWLNRSSAVELFPSFSEFRGGLTYNYSFSN